MEPRGPEGDRAPSGAAVRRASSCPGTGRPHAGPRTGLGTRRLGLWRGSELICWPGVGRVSP